MSYWIRNQLQYVLPADWKVSSTDFSVFNLLAFTSHFCFFRHVFPMNGPKSMLARLKQGNKVRYRFQRRTRKLVSSKRTWDQKTMRSNRTVFSLEEECISAMILGVVSQASLDQDVAFMYALDGVVYGHNQENTTTHNCRFCPCLSPTPNRKPFGHQSRRPILR